MESETFTIRDLRRRWKPTKERLNSEHDSHPTAIRIHRSFSWLASVENEDDSDTSLICRWIAFNAMYGQWNSERREPTADRAGWGTFLERILKLDDSGHISQVLVENKKLVMTILDDEYLSRYFWEEPTEIRAKKSKSAKFKAQTWYIEKRWIMILDRVVERIYLLRCQLMHGAATFGGRLNRTSLRHCSIMLRHLLQGTLLAVIDHGADEDWGLMCYPPLR